MNHDGVPDIAIGSGDGPSYLLFVAPDGTASAKELVYQPDPNAAPVSVVTSSLAALGDINGDGVGDIAVTLEDRVVLLFLQPDGSVAGFESIDNWYGLWPEDNPFHPQSVFVVGDLNGDGRRSLVMDASLSSLQSRFTLVNLNADGTVNELKDVGVSYGSTPIAALGDQNNDGSIDIASVEFTDQGADSYTSIIFNMYPPLLVGDLGDAPDGQPGASVGNFNTQPTDNGPIHWSQGPLYIGASPGNREPVAKATPLADGDDDDGILDPALLTFEAGKSLSLDVIVTNESSEPGILYGWIDANFDGVFDNQTERASAVVDPKLSGADGDSVTLQFPAIPAGVNGHTYVRLRISSDSQSSENPTGEAPDGEVEDYAVTISTPTGIQAADFSVLHQEDVPVFEVLNGGSFDGKPFANAVVDLGDLDGDGVNDIAVSRGQEWSGVQILFLNEDGSLKSNTTIQNLDPLYSEPQSINSYGHNGEYFGIGLQVLHRADSQGVTLAVGAPGVISGPNPDSPGSVFIIHLNPDGTAESWTKISHNLNGGPELSSPPNFDQDNGGIYSLFGQSLAAMDLDGDGNDELIVASVENVYALFLNDNDTVRSSVKFLDRSDVGLWEPVFDHDPRYVRDFQLSPLGDFNGDGVPDLLVGVKFHQVYGGPFDDMGAAFIVEMNEKDWATPKGLLKVAQSTGVPVPPAVYTGFGASVASLGDINDDGVIDIAVGGAGIDVDGDGRKEGTIMLLELDQNGATIGSTILGSGSNGIPSDDYAIRALGNVLASRGDSDGDGLPELISGDGGTTVQFFSLEKDRIDYGDAPVSLARIPVTAYQSPQPPAHKLTSDLFLGGLVDSDGSVNPNESATGDDVNGMLNDEDGLIDPARDLQLTIGQTPSFELLVTNLTGQEATLYGWVDLNQNGAFEEDERAQVAVETDTFFKSIVLRFPDAIKVPDGFTGETYARFRLSTDQAAMMPTGFASDGEVEDWLIAALDTDFGDAPDSFQTSKSSGGPSHLINSQIFLGAKVDGEFDAAPSESASSDDLLGAAFNDEDGVVETDQLSLTAGQANVIEVSVTNNTGSPATLYGWIDFDQSGTFDPVERTEYTVSSGTNGQLVPLQFMPDINVPDGLTYARFRFSTDVDGASEPSGSAADGEVEDYRVTVLSRDYGDAPDSYGTLRSSDGPSHTYGQPVFLGNRVDLELDGSPHSKATGDDLTGGLPGDEDGLLNPDAGLRFTPGEVPIVQLRATNGTDDTPAKVVGWIDLNFDGEFDLDEQAEALIQPGKTNQIVTLEFTKEVPASAVGVTYARFRISTDPNADQPTGHVSDGEVEDYLVTIDNLDYGDAPDTGPGTAEQNYQTLASDDGPTHFVNPSIYLGFGVDAEPDSPQIFNNNGQLKQRLSANGDDEEGIDDEDGLVQPSVDLQLTADEKPEVQVVVTNETGSTAWLWGWIDFDRDGRFESNERSDALSVESGTTQSTRSLEFPFSANDILQPKKVTEFFSTYARFRLSSDPTFDPDHSPLQVSPLGFARDGEVEDYVLTVNYDNSVGNEFPLFVEHENRIQSEHPLSYDQFGSAVTTGQFNGDEFIDIAVGASGSEAKGVVYLLPTDGSNEPHSPLRQLTSETQAAHEYFGNAIAVGKKIDPDATGALLVIGVKGADQSAGAVELQHLDDTGMPVGSRVVIDADAVNAAPGIGTVSTGDGFGHAVATADFDRDGVLDLLVGAPGDDSASGTDLGAVYLLLMDGQGGIKQKIKFDGDNPDLSSLQDPDGNLGKPVAFGSAVALADMDNDPEGVLDLVIGAPGSDPRVPWYVSGPQPLVDSGAVYVILLNRDGQIKSKHVITTRELDDFVSHHDSFGSSLTTADFDGDGITDIAAGAPNDEISARDYVPNNQPHSGSVHLLLMNDGAVSIREHARFDRSNPRLARVSPATFFGSSIAAADLNNDDVMDLVVGAPGTDISAIADSGSVHVLTLRFRRPTPSTLPAFVNRLPELPPASGYQIEAFATSATIADWSEAINNLPEFPRPNEVVTITLKLEAGIYAGENWVVPSGYRLVIDGSSGLVKYVGTPGIDRHVGRRCRGRHPVCQ